MHAEKFLHELLGNVTHKLRSKALIEVVMATITAKQLILTAIGRSIDSSIQERSGIQKVNRLLGNPRLLAERKAIATRVSDVLLGNKMYPNILVDWTKYPASNDVVLRASLAAEGRSLTLYEERHPAKKMGNNRIQKNFLKELKAVLPATCKPTIITDAGFHNDWFREIAKHEWHYVGRIRGMKKCCWVGQDDYFECGRFWRKATEEAKEVGEVILTKKNPLITHLYLIKGKLKGRKVRTKRGKIKRDKDSKNYSRAQREPWLLASSLKGRTAAKKVIRAYKFRMQIEQEFRDLKNNRYGFSLEESRTKKGDRRSILLLIGMLATLLAWMIGKAGERMGLHYQFQSNSIKTRRVLSFVYLGCQLIRKKINIPTRNIWESVYFLHREEFEA